MESLICAECDHNISDHNVTSIPKTDRLHAKCNLCSCDDMVSIA
jgi:hypothetical protein